MSLFPTLVYSNSTTGEASPLVLPYVGYVCLLFVSNRPGREKERYVLW